MHPCTFSLSPLRRSDDLSEAKHAIPKPALPVGEVLAKLLGAILSIQRQAVGPTRKCHYSSKHGQCKIKSDKGTTKAIQENVQCRHSEAKRDSQTNV